MSTKPVGVPTVAELLENMGGHLHSTEGTMLVSRFCAAVENGQVPSQKDLLLLANALKPLKDFQYNLKDKRKKTDNVLRDLLAEVGNRLGFKTHIGKDDLTAIESKALVVVAYRKMYDELIESGKNPAAAKKEAEEFICSKENIVKRTLNNYIKNYNVVADLLQNWNLKMENFDSN